VAVAVFALIVGLAGLTVAADRFVVGAALLATRLQVSTVVTGALIIGFGTSAPELVVSTVAVATEGAEGTALALGNVVGSNVANLTLVLGVPAVMFACLTVAEGTKRQAALSAVGVSVFAGMVHFGGPSVVKGVVLLVLAVALLCLVVVLGDRFGGTPPPATAGGASPWGPTVLGLVGTVGFAHLVVQAATSIADEMGWNGGFVGFGLVAVGTSLPELVTVVAAARRGETGLIFGNLLGSNLFNSLAVGGVVLIVNGGGAFDTDAGLPPWSLLVMVGLSWIVILAMKLGRDINRAEGVALLAGYGIVVGVLAAGA